MTGTSFNKGRPEKLQKKLQKGGPEHFSSVKVELRDFFMFNWREGLLEPLVGDVLTLPSI